MDEFWAVLKTHGMSTLAEFRVLWVEAQRGNADAVAKVFRISRDSAFAANRIAEWGQQRREFLQKKGASTKKRPAKATNNKSVWERHREKAQESKWTPVYPGGLPSLGKRSK